MAEVQKTTSDIQLADGTVLVNIRVAGVGFSSVSGNSVVHRPRAGDPQSVQGHLTGGSVSVDCYITRRDFDAVNTMVGKSVIVRFAYGGAAEGILTNLQASAEPGSWETDDPYVTVSFTVNTVAHVVGLE